MIDIKDMINEPTLGSPDKTSDPRSGERRSSVAQPVNINLGSDTRFSNVGKNVLSGERAAEPQQSAARNKEPVAVSAFDRKQQLENQASEFKSKIKQARARVDCWNRPASRGETTPTRNERQAKTPVHLTQSMGGRRAGASSAMQ